MLLGKRIAAGLIAVLLTIAGGLYAASPAQAKTPVGVFVGYNRSAARNWALDHAQEPQPILWSGCTWFVSQALWHGGYFQTNIWNGQGSHGKVRKVPGTVTATGAPELVTYLRSTHRAKLTRLNSNSFRRNSLPDARVGDLIAYNWEKEGGIKGIDHMALIVSIAKGKYPEVAEWGTAPWNPFEIRSNYRKRGWTWSEKDHVALQVTNPDVNGYLLHMSP